MATLFNVTFITSDVARLAAFWAGALDMTVLEQRADLARLAPRRDGAPRVLVLHSDTPATTTGRMHLDLAAADVAAEARRLIGIGARAADGDPGSAPPVRSANGLAWIVLLDPDGNELCLGGSPAPDGRPAADVVR